MKALLFIYLDKWVSIWLVAACERRRHQMHLTRTGIERRGIEERTADLASGLAYQALASANFFCLQFASTFSNPFLSFVVIQPASNPTTS